MPTYRVTYGYGQANIGWSETWWITGEAPSVASTVNKVLSLRAQMLWNYDYFVGVRIATEGVRRKSQFFIPGTRFWDAAGVNLLIPAAGARTGLGVSTRADQVRAALQLRLQYGSGYSALRYLCPVSDSVTATEPATDDLTGDPGWVAAYIAWRNAIVEDGWSIKSLVPAPGNPEVPIRNLYLQEAAPGLLGLGVITGEALTLPQSGRVHVRGQRKKPSAADQRTMNGVWVVDSTNTTQVSGQVIYYLRNTQGIDPTAFRFLGTVQSELYQFSDVQGLNVHRTGIHKRGKPFGSPRGRRLTRRTLDP